MQGINAISLLLDEPPLGLSAELIRAKRAMPPNPPRVPVGLPSELARRRPDIRVAEAQPPRRDSPMSASAVAEFYPSGAASTRSPDAAGAGAKRDIFKGSSLQYMNIGPSITLADLRGRPAQGQPGAAGEIANRRRRSPTIKRGAVGLARRRQLAHRLQDRADCGASGCGRRWTMPGRLLILARSRYEQGVADFTTLLDDERTVLSAEQQLAQSHGQCLGRPHRALQGARRWLGGNLSRCAGDHTAGADGAAGGTGAHSSCRASGAIASPSVSRLREKGPLRPSIARALFPPRPAS